MKRIQAIYSIHILIAVAALALSYAQGGWPHWSMAVVLGGAMWYTAHQRGAQGFETILFFGFAIAAAAGFWVGLSPYALLVALVASLGAWDLDHFSQRLRLVERVVLDTGLGNNHLRRLFLIESLGLMTGLVGLTSNFQLTFWTQLLLLVLAVFGLSRLVIFIKKELR